MTARVEGYRRALNSAGATFDEYLVVDGVDVGVQGGDYATQQLLGSFDERGSIPLTEYFPFRQTTPFRLWETQ